MPDNTAQVHPPADLDSKSAAFFDVDGTIVSTHIVHQYVHIRKVLSRGSAGRWAGVLHPLWLAGFYARCLHYLLLDQVSRTRMNIAFYRNYRGLSHEAVRAAAVDCFDRVLMPHMFAQAEACIQSHLRARRRVVLVTGSIDFIIAPLADHLRSLAGGDGRVDLIARTLVARNGRFTGELDGPPLGEHEKVRAVRIYANAAGIDLNSSYAYGDSIADLPMLELVGSPNAVNADRELAKHATARGWPRHRWRHDENRG